MKPRAIIALLMLLPSLVLAAPVDGLTQVGEGRMQWLWLELYKARLYSSDGEFEPGRYPLALEITYARDIKASALLDATADEWRKQQLAKADIGRYIARLTPLWVDVRPTDTLLLVAHNSNRGEFFYNGTSLGQVEEPGLMAAFLGIWLEVSTSEPGLRAQLVGEKACDC